MSDNLVVGSSDSSSSDDDDDGDDDIMKLLRAGISEMESIKTTEEDEEQKQTDNRISKNQTGVSAPGVMNIDGGNSTMSHHPLGNRVKQKSTRSSPHSPKQEQDQTREANPEIWLGKAEEDGSQPWRSATGMDAQKKQQLKRKKKILTPAERQERMQRMSKAFVTTSNDTWNKVKMVTIKDDEVNDEGSETDNRKGRPSTTTKTTISGDTQENVVKSQNKAQSPTTQSENPVSDSKITQKNVKDAENLLLADLRYTSNPDQLQVLQRLFQVGEKHGSETVMKWIQHQVQLASIPSEASVTNTIINRNNNNGTSGNEKASSSPSIDTSRDSFGRRFTNNRPKPSIQQVGGIQNIPNNPVLAERRLIKSFRQAVDSVSFQYNYHDENNNIFSFFVRRPYGMETNRHLWQDNNNKQLTSIVTPTDVYSRRAHISTLSTLEVMVLFLFSNNTSNVNNQSTNTRSFPILVLYGTTGVRYRSNLNGPWITVVDSSNDKDKIDRRPSLRRVNLFPSSPFSAYNNPGSITNNTSSAIDLEEIFQQAIFVREHYGQAVTNTAIALSKVPPPVPPSTEDQSSVNPTKAAAATTTTATTPTRDCGVNTTVTSDHMMMLEQDGIRRRGRSNFYDNESNNDTTTASAQQETKKMTTKKKNNVQVSSKAIIFIRYIRSHSSILLLLISFGILLGVWLVRPEAFSQYNND